MPRCPGCLVGRLSTSNEEGSIDLDSRIVSGGHRPDVSQVSPTALVTTATRGRVLEGDGLDSMTTWTDRLNDDPTDWLLDAEPWTRYRTLVDLLDRPAEDADVVQARSELVEHPAVRDLIARTARWFPSPAKRHDDAKLSHYALTVLAEFGLTVEDEPMGEIADIRRL